VSEFARPFRLDTIGTTQRSTAIEADTDERAALAMRFGLVSLDALSAKATLAVEDGAVIARGTFVASLVQSCIASAEDVPATLSEAFSIRFVSSLAHDVSPDEIELLETDCDSVEHDGQVIDLGEAVAQSMGLSLTPFPRSPEAARILRDAGVVSEDDVETGPFAGLKGLLGKA
jgi:uncharacterized metal-binding protein YceD (DUF177 family)